MSIEAWLLFTITETVLCLSPGPAVLLVLSVGPTRGWQPGMQASAGILVATLFYFVLRGYAWRRGDHQGAGGGLLPGGPRGRGGL